jgi:hypothetical protein
MWKKVVFSFECNSDGDCPECGIDYGECPCPGPTQEDLYEYEERNGALWARFLVDHETEKVSHKPDTPAI